MRNIKIRYSGRRGNMEIMHSGRLVPAGILNEPAFIDMPELRVGRSYALFHREGRNALHVSRLFVHENRRRQNVASVLLKSLRTYANARNINKLIIDVSSENKPMLSVVAKARDWLPVRKYPKNYIGKITFVLRLK